MTKKLLVLFWLLTVSAALLFAGGAREPAASGSAPGATSGSASAAAADQPVNLRFSWWGGDVRHQATLAALERYHQLNPNVTVEAEYGAFGTFLQKLLTQLSGNTAPDVFFTDFKWVFDLLSQNNEWFVNMETMQDRIDMSGIDLDFARAWASLDGHLIGLPVGLNAIGLVYNQELVEAAGININNNWTWADVLRAGEAMQRYDRTKHAVFFNQPFYMYLVKVQLKQMTGYDLVRDDYTISPNQQQVEQVFNYIRQLVETRTVPPFEEHVPYELVFADQTPGWVNQRYAISFTSSSHIPTIKNASNFELGVARYPIFPNAANPGLITAPTMMMTLNARSRHLDQAVNFVNWFINDEEAIRILGDTRGLPANERARNILMNDGVADPLIVRLVESSVPFTGGPEGALSQNQEVIKLIDEYVHMVGYGRLTPAAAAERFMRDLTNLVEDLKARR